MRYFSQELLANSALHRSWFGEVSAVREHFHNVEGHFAHLKNSAAVLPRDAWQDMDQVTMTVMRNDEGAGFMNDLMALAKPIDIGKTVAMYRVSSDQGAVVRSMSGQVPTPMDKTVYNYRGHPIPIFATAYGREWREWNTLQSESFDALMDDQEAAVAKIRKDMATMVLRGDTTLSIKGYTAYGIENHPYTNTIDLGTSGANINLRTCTSDQFETFINTTLGAALDNENITSTKVNMYVSPEIARNLDKPYSGSTGFKTGSLRDALLANRRIAKIEATFLLSGNEFFCFVPSQSVIRPRVGMAVSTVAMARQNPMDNYNFHVWGALGLEIRADWNGNCGVFFGKNVT